MNIFMRNSLKNFLVSKPVFWYSYPCFSSTRNSFEVNFQNCIPMQSRLLQGILPMWYKVAVFLLECLWPLLWICPSGVMPVCVHCPLAMFHIPLLMHHERVHVMNRLPVMPSMCAETSCTSMFSSWMFTFDTDTSAFLLFFFLTSPINNSVFLKKNLGLDWCEELLKFGRRMPNERRRSRNFF